MTNFTLVRGRAMRVTRLDACGRTVLGPDSVVVSKGFISIGFTANTEEGEAISVTNANGEPCVLDTPVPRFTGYTAEVAFCGVNPELVNLMTGQPLVMNAAGTQAVGFRTNSQIDLGSSGFALEAWSVVPSGGCDDENAEGAYGYFLFPFLKGGVLGDFAIANDAVNFTLSGATTRDGTEWGVGPFDVTRDENGVAGPLNEPMDTYDHKHLELVTVPPPTPEDGAIALGVEATGATAGIPATLTPANSYAPLNLADAPGLTATPSTDWTVGQHVKTRSGQAIHWNGTTWVAGEAT